MVFRLCYKERVMKTCLLCKNGHYQEGFTTVVFTKQESVVIIKQVPALVCSQCGEYILSSDISQKVLAMAQGAISQGAEVELRKFTA